MFRRRDRGASSAQVVVVVVVIVLVGGALAAVYQNLSMEVTSFSSQNDSLSQQVSSLRSMVAADEANISTLQATVASLSASVGQDSGVIAQDSSEVSALQSQVAQEQSEIQSLQSQTTPVQTTTVVTGNATSREGSVTGGPVPGCYASGSDQASISCQLSIATGDLVMAEVSGVPEDGNGSSQVPPTPTDQTGLKFTLVASVSLPTSNYVEYLFTAVAQTGGSDTFSLSGPANYPSLVIHTLPKGDKVVASSTGSSASSGPTNAAEVTAYSPPAGSFVIAAVLTRYSPTAVGAGSGYQPLLGSGQALWDEDGTPSGPTTSSFSLNPADNWTEISIAISTTGG